MKGAIALKEIEILPKTAIRKTQNQTKQLKKNPKNPLTKPEKPYIDNANTEDKNNPF